MKFQNGGIFTLNGITYHIQERLGRGAVSDVYLALIDGLADARVVIKVVRDDDADDLLKIEALQCEADTLTTLNQAEDPQWATQPDARARFRLAQRTALQRKIIAVLDTGEPLPGQPCVVQEIAPPAFERFPVESPADEARLMRVTQAVLDVMVLTHQQGLSLKDFEPGTKGDRIRVQWLDDEHQDFVLKVIDWNITGGPEAMEQDLFFFGGHLHYWLTGRHVHVDAEGRPPANLGMGNPAWETLTAGSRQLVNKLLHRDPQRRYSSVEDLAVDVAWWNEILAQITASSVFRRLDDRLWQARPAGRFDRVLAIADLALHLNPPSDARQSFEQSLKQAQEELDKENWQPIAHAQVTLGTRAYEKAALEFAQQLRILPPESEAARLARIYQLLAGVGGLLKQNYRGDDERRAPEWEALEGRAIPALVQRRWQDAQTALAVVEERRSQASDWQPFKVLINWADAGAEYSRDVTAAFMEAENRADPVSDDWLGEEQSKIDVHQAALDALKKVHKKATSEPEFKERLAIERNQIELRKRFYDLYNRAAEILAQAQPPLKAAQKADKQGRYAAAAGGYEDAAQKYQNAHTLFNQVLADDATQRRALLYAGRVQKYLEQIQSRQQQATALHQAQQDLAAGNYEHALEQIQAVLRLAPGRKDAQQLQSQVKQKQLDTLLEKAQREIDSGQYPDAKPYVQQVLSLAPERRDAQAMDVEVDAGVQLLEQVDIYLQGAETYLGNDEFDQALEQLGRFDGWNGRALRDLPGGQALVQAAQAQPFHLPAGLRERANRLRQQIENTRNTLRDVRVAWEDDDFREVIGLCEAFAERFALTPTLENLMNEARRRQGNQEHAEPLIANPAGFKDLRKALRLIEKDQGRAAQNLRDQAANQWRRLAQSQVDHLETRADWDGLLSRLREGQRLFNRQADSFKEMFALVERARDLAFLDALASEEHPNWLALNDWHVRLAQVEEGLTELSTSDHGWPALQQLVSRWRGRLLKHVEALLEQKFTAAAEQYPQKQALIQHVWNIWNNRLPARTRQDLSQSLIETFLQQQFGELRQLARQRSFNQVKPAIDALWDGFPQQTRANPQAGWVNDVRNFRAQLAVRLAADKALAEVTSKLAARSADGAVDQPVYSFQDAAAAVREVTLPAHPDIPKTDWEAVRADLEQAAQIEALAAIEPVADLIPPRGRQNYAQLINRCRTEAKPEFPALSAYTSLASRLATLRQTPADKRQGTVKQLVAALGEAVKEQTKNLSRDPQPILDLYQQAWWSQSIELAEAPYSMESARKLPQKTLEKVAEQLVDLRDLVGFDEPELLLKRAVTLNNGLLTYQSDKLPPLPENVSRAEAGHGWSLPSGTLEQFQTGVSELEQLLHEVDALEPPAVAAPAPTAPPTAEDAEAAPVAAPATTSRYDADQVRAVLDLARQLRPVLDRVYGAWHAFELRKWQPTDGLDQLAAEVPHHVTMADQCAEAQRLLHEAEAMQGLQVLSQEIEGPGVLQALESAKLALLAKPRQVLTLNCKALRQDLIAALGQQVAKILPLRDAAEQLQIQVLELAQAQDVGEAAYQAILKGVELRAQQAQEEGRKDEAIRLWKVVMDATEPWADGDVDAAKLKAAELESQQKGGHSKRGRAKKTESKRSRKATESPSSRPDNAGPPSAPEPPPRRAVPSAKSSSTRPTPPRKR